MRDRVRNPVASKVLGTYLSPVRTPLALALVLLAACGSDRRDSAGQQDAPTVSISTGPDPIVLRVPRAGGTARAYLYPRLDSVAWTSTARLPALERVLAFDDGAGLVAFEDGRNRPGRLDLRAGSVSTTAKPPLTGLTSSDGSAIFGLADGTITRLTPTGTWSFKPPATVSALYPQPDGTLLAAGVRGEGIVVWRLRPPETAITDSVVIAQARRPVTAAGDRVYFTGEQGRRLFAVRPRDLSAVAPLELEVPLRAVAATPSGDRLFVASDSSRELAVVDRYADRVRGSVELPVQPRELRMDPLGRYLLVRAADSDSVYVIAVGTDSVVGAVTTRWLADLPAVAPDGAIALARGDDVVFVDGATLRPRRTIEGGARDFWHFLFWNGFRPRAAGLDEPVAFQETVPDTSIWGVPVDSAAAAGDTAPRAQPAPVDTARLSTPPPPPPPSGWMVSFAALLSDEKAREQASQIVVNGQRARVVVSTRTGTAVYRVVLGPYPTRAEAEHVGREAGQSFWVYQGTP